VAHTEILIFEKKVSDKRYFLKNNFLGDEKAGINEGR
jgi:hypothetical protein